MLFLALALQVAAQAPDAPRVDSVYATPYLRDFIARASAANRAPPTPLAGYDASVESELAFVIRDSLGREMVGQVEQAAATARWTRDGRYDLHVIGYRSQSMGAPYSALTFARFWTVPTLYGNRLFLGMNDGVPLTGREAAAVRKRVARDSATGRQYHLVHPLADDRDGYYRFSGGDTVATVMSGQRAIPIVRVIVTPVGHPRETLDAFRGELDFDAQRYQLVRMRGRLVRLSDESAPLLARATGFVAVAYMEFENAEFEGTYWLPVFERSEFQAQVGTLGENRPVFRLISRFHDYHLVQTASLDHGDSLSPTHATLTYATHDSVSRYADWRESLGAATSHASAGDFDDLAPDVWRSSGAPRVSYWPHRFEDVVRYNRVEGMFTGVGGEVRFRDAAPGLTARFAVGGAWAEQTARGSATLALRRGRWTQSLLAERTLATTNDFLLPLESGLSIGPLLAGVDNYDYVDRRIAAYSVTRVVGSVDRGLVSAEIGYGSDAGETNHLHRLLFGDSLRPNRNATPGAYARLTLSGEYHPRVNGPMLTNGLGMRVQYQAGRGDLDWQRVEVGLTGRRYWGGLSLSGHVDAGGVFGAVIPPQQIFELGGGDNAQSFVYKEFGGDRAALGRGLVAYYLPVWRTPRRVWKFIVPGISPGVGVGMQSGWAAAMSAAGRQALLALGGDGVTPLSRPTDGVRSVLDFRVTFLSGVVGFGVARSLDRPDGWKRFVGFGLSY